MADAIDRLAQVVAEQAWEALPEAVRRQAQLVLLDTLGVILAGSTAPEVHDLTALLTGSGGVGATVLGPGFPAADPRTAALVNGIAGRTPELCEGHRFASAQAGVQVLPTVLALGEQLGVSGREALMALVVGYEAAVRIGLAATPRPRAHQNGQWPLLGAVAAGARLHGFDARRTARALRIGAPLVLTPSYSHVGAGATALNAAGGMAGFAGVLVPDLVLAGFESYEGAVEEAFGGLVGDGFAPERLDEELGSRWEITRNHFRLRACCNPIYPALDALEDALAELRPEPEEVERIEVATYRFASLMREPEPRNEFGAHYSLPQAAAALVVRRRADRDCFSEAALRDPALAALRRRVVVSEDPALTARAPERKSARVTVTLTDGRTITRACDTSRGGFERPYERNELLGKFRALAGEVLQPAGVREAEGLLERFEELEDVGELMAALRRGGRARGVNYT